MYVDYTSLEAAAQAVKNSGYKKFRINRPGALKNAPAVFEYLTASSSQDAVDKFTQWAKLVDGRNVYEISLFSNEDQLSDEPGKRGKSAKFTFSLSGVSNHGSQVNGQVISPDAIVNQVMAKMEENAVLKALSGISARLEKLENPEENEDEEEDDAPDQSQQWNPEKLMVGANMFLDKLIALRTKQPGATINGPSETGNTQETAKNDAPEGSTQERVNAAFKTIKRTDQNWLADLEMLAEMGEKGELETICKFLATIRSNDANYVAHLSKLGTIAADNKPMYNMALSALKNIP